MIPVLNALSRIIKRHSCGVELEAHKKAVVQRTRKAYVSTAEAGKVGRPQDASCVTTLTKKQLELLFM